MRYLQFHNNETKILYEDYSEIMGSTWYNIQSGEFPEEYINYMDEYFHNFKNSSYYIGILTYEE